MLQSAAPRAAYSTNFRAEGHPPEAHPRLRVQAGASRTKRRHLVRAVRRVAVLGLADAAVILGAREFLHAVREAPALGAGVSTLFPQSFMGGWGSAAAIVVGLVFAGSYGSQERWTLPQPVFKGVAIGSALAMWQSIDSLGLGWTLLRWAVVVGTVGFAIAVVRHGLGILVLRYRLAAGPRDRVILVASRGPTVQS